MNKLTTLQKCEISNAFYKDCFQAVFIEDGDQYLHIYVVVEDHTDDVYDKLGWAELALSESASLEDVLFDTHVRASQGRSPSEMFRLERIK